MSPLPEPTEPFGVIWQVLRDHALLAPDVSTRHCLCGWHGKNHTDHQATHIHAALTDPSGGFEVYDAPHWHMPYCPDDCTIKTTRTWTRTEVTERHDPTDIARASEFLHQTDNED